MTPSQSTYDLVRRLRDRVRIVLLGHSLFGERSRALVLEAADTIERLQRELAARDKTIETLRGVLDVASDRLHHYLRDIDAARSEGGKP